MGQQTMMYYYLYLNIITIVLYGWDKEMAKNKGERIPERILFLVGLLGGAAGGFIGMFAFHHKTKKTLFYLVNGVGLFFHLWVWEKVLQGGNL